MRNVTLIIDDAQYVFDMGDFWNLFKGSINQCNLLCLSTTVRQVVGGFTIGSPVALANKLRYDQVKFSIAEQDELIGRFK